MSERTTYPPGVPCWVDTLQPDPEAARSFYGALFGWQFDGPGEIPGDPPGQYFVAQVRGRDVAGVGSPPPTPDARASWNTHVAVDSADRAAEAAEHAGGTVLEGPFDAPPAGRMAVLADPSGAVFGVWEPGDRDGAQLVNEPSAWAMSALQTPEPGACAAFYAAVFGWQQEEFAPGVSVLRLPEYVGGEPEQPVPLDVVAAMIASEDQLPSRWSVDFWVHDADQTSARAAELGGAILTPPFEGGGGMRQAVLADPSGAAFTVTTAPYQEAS